MSELDTLFAAIEKQRWYFFENNPYIIFDKDTGFIWTNLEYFPYNNGTKGYTADEAKKLVENANSLKWGGLTDWRFPDKVYRTFPDKTFPYNRILNSNTWFIAENMDNEKISIVFSGDKSLIVNAEKNTVANVLLMTCDYSSHYTPILFLSVFFFRSNFIPIFDDAKADLLYKKLTEGKPKPPAKVEVPQIKFPAMIDFLKYDAATINKSPIKFYQSVSSATDEVLNYLQQYEKAAAETISEASKILLKLNAKYIASPHLTTEENSLLETRQQFLARRLELDTDDTKLQILSMKAQAEELAARIDEINHSKNSLFELAELEKSPRPSFEFLTENLTQIITFAQDKINFFVQNKNFVKAIVKAVEAWSDDYNSFKTNLRAQFENICRQNNIDAEIYIAWYEDWQKLRFEIEGRVLPLIEFALKENFGDTAIKSLEILANYKGKVDEFYLNERKNIYQKFAFQAGGDLQEKFEVESALYKLTENLQRSLQKIIFACDKTETRVFLLRWSEILTNIPIDELTAFVKDKNLDAISVEVLNQFAELKERNFAAYLADSAAYSEALQKREQEFNALIFKMRKDLHKQ